MIDMTFDIFIFLLTCLGIMLVLGMFNGYLPRWFCDHLGWHLTPREVGFDGCSCTGVCPRCGKNILQDSQGGWF